MDKELLDEQAFYDRVIQKFDNKEVVSNEDLLLGLYNSLDGEKTFYENQLFVRKLRTLFDNNLDMLIECYKDIVDYSIKELEVFYNTYDSWHFGKIIKMYTKYFADNLISVIYRRIELEKKKRRDYTYKTLGLYLTISKEEKLFLRYLKAYHDYLDKKEINQDTLELQQIFKDYFQKITKKVNKIIQKQVKINEMYQEKKASLELAMNYQSFSSQEIDILPIDMLEELAYLQTKNNRLLYESMEKKLNNPDFLFQVEQLLIKYNYQILVFDIKDIVEIYSLEELEQKLSIYKSMKLPLDSIEMLQIFLMNDLDYLKTLETMLATSRISWDYFYSNYKLFFTFNRQVIENNLHYLININKNLDELLFLDTDKLIKVIELAKLYKLDLNDEVVFHSIVQNNFFDCYDLWIEYGYALEFITYLKDIKDDLVTITKRMVIASKMGLKIVLNNQLNPILLKEKLFPLALEELDSYILKTNELFIDLDEKRKLSSQERLEYSLDDEFREYEFDDLTYNINGVKVSKMRVYRNKKYTTDEVAIMLYGSCYDYLDSLELLKSMKKDLKNQDISLKIIKKSN